MSEASTQTFLQRKARAGRQESQARVMTPARALRLALARAADERFDLALTVSGILAETTALDPLLGSLDDDMLFLLLDGPSGALGAAALDLSMVAALIEAQTMGQVQTRKPEPRATTQTDAAIAAPLIDAMLAGLVENLSAVDGADWAQDYRFGARVENVRMLGLALDAPEYQLFRVQAELGEGARRGELVLALPEHVAGAETAETDDRHPDGDATPDHVVGDGAALVAKARLDAVLARLRLSVAEVGELKPGTVLSLPRDALMETRLEAGKDNLLSLCRLGQISGFRAVRLLTPDLPKRSDDASARDAGEDDDILNNAQATAPHMGEAVSMAPRGLPAPVAGDPAAALLQDDVLEQAQPDLPDLSDLPGLGELEGEDVLPAMPEAAMGQV